MICKGLGSGFLLILVSFNAFSQNNRSAVASTGLDSNSCTVASPCRSFGAAISHTNPHGEIIALDSAGYGPFSISFGITISGAPGVHAAITATTGQTAILINAGATDKVTLRNLVLIGAGGTDGVVQATGGDLYIGGLLVRGFINHGIASQNGNLTIEHSVLQDLPGFGVLIGNGGVGFARGTIVNSTVEWADTAVGADPKTRVAIVGTTIAESNFAVFANCGSSNQGDSTVTVKSCALVHNNEALVESGDSGVTSIYLSDSLVAGNAIVANPYGGPSLIYSFGNNTLADNDSDGTAMTPVALK